MSYARGTTNYNLPQTQGTDKRDWADTNTAFAAIDTAIKTANDTASSADSAASAAQTRADNAYTLASTANTAAGNAATAAATASELAQTAKTRADNAYTNVGNLSSLTTSAKSSAVAAINEVNGALPLGTLLSEAIADGVKTYSQILSYLENAFSFNNLRVGLSKLVINSNNVTYVYTLVMYIGSNNTAYFEIGGSVYREVTLQANGSPQMSYGIWGQSAASQLNEVPSSGTTIRVYY